MSLFTEICQLKGTYSQIDLKSEKRDLFVFIQGHPNQAPVCNTNSDTTQILESCINQIKPIFQKEIKFWPKHVKQCPTAVL